nr:GntR family transcriptional regulator [Nocardioidaceae bacterium]
VRTQVAAMVAEGELAAWLKLPTVRQLAATARALGLSMAETTRLVERAWSQPTR